MRAADYVVLAGYFAVMLWIGLRYAPYMKAYSTYFAGERALPWWLSGVSFFMTYVSSLSIVVYAGIGYKLGLVSLAIYWTTVPCCLVSTLLLAKKWQKAVALTPMDFLERRYHAVIRQLFAWTGMPLKLIDDGLKLLALGFFLSRGLGLPLDVTLLAVGGIVVAYTLLGGIWAVALTDAIQFVIILIALVLVLWLGVARAGGVGGLVSGVPDGFWRPLAGDFTLTFIIATAVLSLMAFSSNWSLIQRFYSSRTEGEALRAGLMATVCFIVIPPLWIFAGIAARVALGGGLPDQQLALAELSVRVLPPGILGLMVAALMAAAMSTLSADYNVVASVVTVDFLERFRILKGGKLRWARLLTVLVGAVPVTVALMVAHMKVTIFDAMMTVFSLLTAPMTLPLAAGLLTRRVGWRSALGAFIAGTAAGLALLCFKGRLDALMPRGFQITAIFATTAVTLATMVLLELLLRRRREEEERIAMFFASLIRRQEPGSGKNLALPSPLALAGTGIVVTGAVIALVGVAWSQTLTLVTGLAMTVIGGICWKAGRVTEQPLSAQLPAGRRPCCEARCASRHQGDEPTAES